MSFLNSALMRRTAALIALLFAASVSACNTMEGAGEDIQSGGRALERGAEDAKD